MHTHNANITLAHIYVHPTHVNITLIYIYIHINTHLHYTHKYTHPFIHAYTIHMQIPHSNTYTHSCAHICIHTKELNLSSKRLFPLSPTDDTWLPSHQDNQRQKMKPVEEKEERVYYSLQLRYGTTMQPTGAVKISEKLWKFFCVMNKTAQDQDRPDLKQGLRAAL